MIIIIGPSKSLQFQRIELVNTFLFFFLRFFFVFSNHIDEVRCSSLRRRFVETSLVNRCYKCGDGELGIAVNKRGEVYTYLYTQ